MKKQCVYFLLSALLGNLFLLTGTTLFAADLKSGESVKIIQPVNGDLYVGTGELELSAPVRGDLVAAGGKLVILDSVYQDLLITGGEIHVTGWIGDDIRVGGGEVEIDGYVRGDVLAAGGTLLIGPNAVIEGDLIIAGGEVTIKGLIKGEAKAVGGSISFSGTVQGALKFSGGELMVSGAVRGPAELAAEKITLSEGARFEGAVHYWQEAGEIDFGAAMVSGKAIYDPELKQEYMEKPDWGRLGMGFGVFWLIRLLSVLLTLIVFTWLFGQHFRRAGEIADLELFRSLGIGALYLLGVPLLSVILMALVIGIPLGLAGFTLYGLSFLFGGVITAFVWTHFADLRLGLGLSKGMAVLTALVVFILLKALAMIPILGWLIFLFALLVAFGALVESVWRREQG